ncbi:MAG: enoyl-CoA hydratase/isomerase family protein [Cyanobacteria bacterium J06634_5]
MNKLENTTIKPVEQLRLSCLVADCQQNILTITLNRPKVLNAIDLEMAEQFLKSLLAAAKNPAIRAIVLTGAGRAFCAGGDLKFAHQVNPETPGDSFLGSFCQRKSR